MKVGTNTQKEIVMCTRFRLCTEDPHFAIENEGSYPVEISDRTDTVIVLDESDLEIELSVLFSGLIGDENPVCRVVHHNG